ncbi:MAG: hypothetical protein WAU01_12230, partial [Saprospiraceae bacterium]
ANLTGTTNDAIQDFTTWCLLPGAAIIQVEVRDQNNCSTTANVTITMQSCFDLALRKRVALPNKQYYPGDTVTFNIEVFNQGTVHATNVRVSDILDVNMQYLLSHNTAILTGNDHDWTAGINDSMHTMINRIDAGQKKTIKVVLSIKANSQALFMVNTALVTGAQSEVPFGSSFRYKDNPIDEDKLIPRSTPPTRLPEKDDEICDNMNASHFSGECSLGDDMDDEDSEDFAIVSICNLASTQISREECVSSNLRAQGLQINTVAFKDALDPTGNGDGIINNGDSGNRLVSFHNTHLDAMMGTNPITGKIIFANGNGAINSSHGTLTLQGDLSVFSNQSVEVFGRLLALDGCIAVSVLTFHFTPQAVIVTQPTNVIALLDQQNVCFEVELDDSLGIPFNIQWQEQINGVYTDIPGATDKKYCVGVVTVDNVRRKFRVTTFVSTDVNRSCELLSLAASIELEGDPTLVCHELINVSLDLNCSILITPQMILQDIKYESRIRIKIIDKNGAEVPNPITSAYIGQTLTVSAIDIINGNSCWSKIKIEDKLPPVIDCPLDYTVSCANAGFAPPIPHFYDSCDPLATIHLIKDTLSELACGRADSIIAVRELSYI